MGFLRDIARGLVLECQLLRWGVVGLAALSPLLPDVVARAEMASGEYALKAAFIYNFAKFVEWPESAFKRKKEFCIGTLGRSPLDHDLGALKGRTVNGRSIVVRHFSSLDDAAAQCQILFITRSDLPRLERILEALADQPVLTVGDTEDFCRKGGMLALEKQGGKLVFDANYREMQRARLKPNSQMLKLARKVYGK